ADVGGAPEDVIGLDVEGVVHRHRRLQQITTRRVLHALRLAGGTGGVQDVQRMFGLDPVRLAAFALPFDDVVHPAVAPLDHGHVHAGTLEDDDVLHGPGGIGIERFV